MHLGIDFGTTRTVVALCDRGNYPVVSFVGDSGDALDWYPSVVAERGGELRFGFDALQAASDPGWSVLRSFKRLLSDPKVAPDLQVTVGETTLPLVELLARFLSALRTDVLTRSNAPPALRREEPLRAVVATPANAHGTQRFLTLDAFRRAGFEVMAMLNEPSAAGFEYAHRHRSTLTSRREHVVVYDLGGGTFDVSLVRMSGQHHDVITTAGIGRLGGDDFDAKLLELVLEAIKLSPSKLSAHQLDQLTELCRQAKESLNPNSRRVVVELEGALGKLAPSREVSIAAPDYYEACAPLIERSIEAMVPVMNRIEGEEAAASDDSELSDIAGIYVVGGASTLPAVGRVLRKRFGRRVHRSPYSSAATAIGLAIAGDTESGFRLSDRFSRTFGVFREAEAGARICFDPIFMKETRIPSEPGQKFVSSRTYRAAHNVGHFRYVECSGLNEDGTPDGDITPYADVVFPFEASLRSGQKDLRQVCIERATNPGPLVQELYAVDSHGIVVVTITDLDAGYESVHRLCS